MRDRFQPGGNHLEVANAGARLILAPDWKPIVWTEESARTTTPGAEAIKIVYAWHAAGVTMVSRNRGLLLRR